METYGSLSKKEKVEYILEQLRLTIVKQDYVRAAIVAGKINRKHLQEMANYKIQFYTLLATIHRHEHNALELMKDYHAIYLTLVSSSTTSTSGDGDGSTPEPNEMDMTTSTTTSSWSDALSAVIVFLLLAPYSNEQQDILHHVSIDTHLEKIPLYYQYVPCDLFACHFYILKRRISQFVGHLLVHTTSRRSTKNTGSYFFSVSFPSFPMLRVTTYTQQQSHCTNVIETRNYSISDTKFGRH